MALIDELFNKLSRPSNVDAKPFELTIFWNSEGGSLRILMLVVNGDTLVDRQRRTNSPARFALPRRLDNQFIVAWGLAAESGDPQPLNATIGLKDWENGKAIQLGANSKMKRGDAAWFDGAVKDAP